jgi:hypothetical protein
VGLRTGAGAVNADLAVLLDVQSYRLIGGAKQVGGVAWAQGFQISLLVGSCVSVRRTKMQQAMFWEQARARRVFVSAGASGGCVMDDEVVLGERIRSQSEDLARALFGYRKAFQSASSKAERTRTFSEAKHRKQTRDRTLASSMPRRHSRQSSQ